jgi:DNA helicase-2/ATP-dependent DNA helicase PcrA
MLQADRSAESAGRLENLTELTRAMEEYETLGAFLEHVSLVMENDADRETEKVTIMTIHAAKGLEFGHRLPRRLGGRRLPLAALIGRRRQCEPGGGTAPRLCRDHPGAAQMLHRPRRQSPNLRPVDEQHPSRFVTELPAAHIIRRRR